MALRQQREADERRRYTVYVSRVLSDTVVKALQNLVQETPLRAVVEGERAFNAFVGTRYRVDASEWSVGAWTTGNATPPGAIARTVASRIARAAAGTVSRQSLRLAVIDDHFATRLDGIAVGGPEADGRTWSVMLSTTRWGRVPLVRVTPRARAPADRLVLDGVTFVGPTAVMAALRTVAASESVDPAIRMRASRLAASFERAAGRGELAANVYRHLLIAGAQAQARAVAVGLLPDVPRAARDAMARRVASTAMGPPDRRIVPLGVPLRPPRPRFRASDVDVATHDAYIRSLPAPLRRALLAYTGPASGPINLALIDRFFGSGAASAGGVGDGQNDPLVLAERIQRALLAAPALAHDAVVYKVARFLYFGGDRCDACVDGAREPETNYGLRVGDVDRQWVFNSTTLDNWLNFGPFMDEFASCCAFVVRVPRGARGALILGRNSAFPGEHEMLLPYGCAFRVRRRWPGEVTFDGVAQSDRLFYQDTTVYDVDYVPPESIDGADGQVGADTATLAAAAASAGPWRVDMASSLRTPAHVAAAAGHPRLGGLLAALLGAQLNAGMGLPGFADV